jgi:hypothetical protein
MALLTPRSRATHAVNSLGEKRPLAGGYPAVSRPLGAASSVAAGKEVPPVIKQLLVILASVATALSVANFGGGNGP